MTCARLALYPCLLLLANCASTELEKKEAVVQTALDAAFLACQSALNDPRMEFAPGARAYCLKVVSPDGCAK